MLLSTFGFDLMSDTDYSGIKDKLRSNCFLKSDKMSTFPVQEFRSEVYRWRKRENDKEKRILVKIFYKTPNLQKSDDKTLWRNVDKNGIDKDAVYLKTLFEDNKYFPAGAEVDIRAVGTFDRTKEILEEIDTKISENEHYDCFFFVFLTFSEPDGRLQFKSCQNASLDTGLVHLEKIVDVVKNLSVTRGKPKIFLIQADDMTLTELQKYPKGPGEGEKLVKIPTDVDRLIIQSTIPQKIVTGEGRQESFLIQAFVEAIKENSDSKNKQDFLSLTTTINGKVTAMIQNTRPVPVRAKDMPVPLVTSTLTKFLNLHEC